MSRILLALAGVLGVMVLATWLCGYGISYGHNPVVSINPGANELELYYANNGGAGPLQSWKLRFEGFRVSVTQHSTCAGILSNGVEDIADWVCPRLSKRVSDIPEQSL